jgi:hypothetical protein
MRRTRPSLSVYALCLTSLVNLVGCGGPFDSKVSGKVTLNGASLARGVVTYVPVSGGPAAYAPIDDDGTYVIHTGREAGLPSGDYQVTVAANEPSAERQTSKGGPPPPGKLITPTWYRAKETSGLKFTVQPGKNEINLELTTEPPAGWKPSGRK